MADDWTGKTTMDGMDYYYNPKTKEVSWSKPEVMMSAQEVEENRGDWVWVPHPTHMWQAARVTKRDDDGTVHVVLEDGDLMRIPPSRVMQGPETNGREQPVPLWELKKGNLRFLEDDLVMLDPVNEAFIIRNLARRYEKQEIYTWVGAGRTVLVSVNPYQELGLYDDKHVHLHRFKPPNKPIPPHVFDIANDAYDSMAMERTNQSILISGESGAGKTEATKQCLQYLASTAGSDTNVEEKVLVANPLLEAFGNAKTIRNINSSRFGKWMEVFFNPKTSKMVGSKITNYLLERSRVVHQQKDERNFHIFYELCFNERIKEMYNITVPEDYRYLSQSGCVKVPQIDDDEDFTKVVKAMDILEFSSEDQESILQLTAAVLWLGNIEFSAKMEEGSVEGSEIKAGEALGMVAKFLELSEETVAKILCYRTIRPRAGKDSAVIPLNPKDARTACDSLAMGIYGKLFNWMVMRVNEALGEQEGRFIGILDIFGFEIFENNSFEQLCINYANEKLQQLFNKTTFKEEEELYQREGVKYEPIVFIDNQPVLDMVEQKPNGILPLLDDECLIPQGSDLKFMKKLESFHAGTILQTDVKRKFASSLSFEIKHYAGVVCYDASLFMTKNLDTVYEDMHAAMVSSDNELLTTIFEGADTKIKTLSNQFRGQLNKLMEVLYDTESRFIRCIKPNDQMSPNTFISSNCIEQLRYSGVFEAVDIRKTGYPFRYSHRRFVYRYSCINQGYKYKTNEKDSIARIGEILSKSHQDFSGVQIGNSMVLYKANEYKLLKLLRNLALETIIPKIQGVLRGGSLRRYSRVLKERVKDLDRQIKAANDYEAITKAIDAASPNVNFTPSQLRLYKFSCPNLPVALKLKSELEEWLVLERKMQALKEECGKGKIDDFYNPLTEIEKKVTDMEAMQKKKADEAPKNFYKQKTYVQPKLTKKQRDLHKDMKDLIDECVRGQLDTEVDTAIRSYDRAALTKSLVFADEISHDTLRIQEGRELIKAFKKLDVEAQEAVKCVSRTMLEKVCEKADDLRQKNEYLTAAREMYELPEKTFVEKEYERAKEVADREREIHREIRLLDYKYEEIDYEKFSIKHTANYRNPEDFAKAKFSSKFYGKDALIQGFKKWSKSPLPTSLTIPEFEAAATAGGNKPTPEEKLRIKNFKKEAKQNFKDMMMYLGDIKCPARGPPAAQLLQRGVQAYQRDDDDLLMEMYAQVIKQLTDNPTKSDAEYDPRSPPENCTSYQNALALLAMMMSTFPPSTKPYEVSPVATPTLDDSIIVWVMTKVTQVDRQRFISALHNVKYGTKPRVAEDPSVVRNKFAELKGIFSLDREQDSGPTEDKIHLYLN